MEGNRHLRMTVNPDDTVTVTNKHGTELLVDINGERGLSPLELLLAALGACSAVDFAILMRKQRDPVEPLHLEVDGDKEDQRMQWLRVTYHVHEGADERKVERSRSKVANDLCTVSRTIASGTPVDHVIS
ncbi:MAG TPA: OsmC family protein [Actinomycetota bacterium]|jgi:putative redox protein|nr:OsmC family protein [Actinomycetota bacterium]